MLGSETGATGRPWTAIVLGSLVAFIAAVVLLVFGSVGGDEKHARTRAVSTTAPVDIVTTTTRGEIDYTVVAGDTLISISQKFGISQARIISANNLANPDNLVAGQVLKIPPVIPKRVIVRPAKVSPGETINLKLTGAEATEGITFKITRPNASTFTGRSHLADSDGTVKTTYTIGATDPPGTYTVTASGDQGTSAQATFEVVPATVTTAPS
jgi:LysM repeat protein